MKVIGKISNDKYIVEIRHTEIEQFLNLYYNKLEKLDINDEIDLGTGYDWWSKSQTILEKTREFFNSYEKLFDTVTKTFLEKNKINLI